MPNAGQLLRGVDDSVPADVTTPESTTSTSYTDLATSGPAVSVALRAGQKCLIIGKASSQLSAEGALGALHSFDVSGAETIAATDADGVENGNLRWTPGTWVAVFTATTGGTYTFTMKYKVIGVVTGSWKLRRIVALPQP